MFNIFGTKVSVHQGDPLKVEADALVIPANDHLWMGAGLAGIIKKEGGEEIEVEAVKQGPARLGQAIATGAGELAFQRLYHVVLAGQDLKPVHDQIVTALGAAMEAARRDGLATLAVAPLEDETAIGAFHEASHKLVDALLAQLGGKTSLRSIVLIASSDAGCDAHRQALHQGLAGHA